MEMFSKLSWFFKQEKKAYIVGTLSLIFLSILTAIMPLIIGWIIDSMANQTMTRNQLTNWVLLILLITLLQYVVRYVWRMAIFGTSAKLERILRSRLFSHFMKMDTNFFQKYRTGDLMARTTNDLNAIRMVAAGGILTLVDSLAQGLITLFMMFVIVDWRLSLVSIVPIPFLAIFIRFIGQRLHYHSRLAQAAFSSMNDKVQESVSGMKVIKTFGEEQLDVMDFRRKTHEIVQENERVHFYDASFRPMAQLIMGTATIISVFFGGFLVVQGDITIGLLVAFISYVTRLTWPMVAVGRLFNILQRGAASYDRIEEILSHRSHIIETKNAVGEKIMSPLDFNVKEFIYPAEKEVNLLDVKFTLENRQTLGIVGKTGSGKTTLFKLMMREYDSYEGVIQFNHIDIKDYSLDALLNHIGYVPQDNFLFSTTVRDNIRYAKPDASQEEVEAVAKLANVHNDILNFPKSYDTRVGERGVSLSGGQKQRIAIARALLTQPELLILDDSLSAVDAKTEEAILSSIRKDKSDRMTIIAAHRLSSVMHADEILVMANGKVTERGTHDDLIALEGWYAEMYAKQLLERGAEEVEDDF